MGIAVEGPQIWGCERYNAHTPKSGSLQRRFPKDLNCQKQGFLNVTHI